MKPNEGIRRLRDALRRYRPDLLPRYLAADLADLRRAIPDDEPFGDAVSALADAIEIVHRKRERVGRPLSYGLDTWYRYAFSSKDGFDLRVVYQPLPGGGLRLLGFGHRHLPHSIDRRVSGRTPR